MLDASGLRPGDVAGFALFNRPYAWLGVSVDARGRTLTYVTEDGGEMAQLPLLSLATHRYVRLDREAGRLAADSPGPHPNERDGVRWAWHAPPAR